ncbi:MAG: hypothetical protein ABUS47_11550 [Steroidobacter sp.]
MKQIFVAFSLLLLLAATPAMADCTYPQPPSVMPDANTATKDQMLTAAGQYKQYNSDVDAYIACLDQETEAKVKEASGVGAIMAIKALQEKKKNTAMDERQAKIDEFNKQIRIFKSKG